MILCLYMTLPFVVIVKDKLSGSTLTPVLFLPALILFLNSMVLPAVNTLLKMNDLPVFSSKLREADIFSYFYLYVIAGYLVGKGYLSGWQLRWVGLWAAVSFGLCCGFQFYAYSQPMDYVVSYNFPLLPICGAFLFELIRRGAHRLHRMEKIIAYLSRISFGIYFLHIVIMTVVNTAMDFADWLPSVKLVFLLSASMLASVAVIAVLSRIKPLRKYLFLIK